MEVQDGADDSDMSEMNLVPADQSVSSVLAFDETKGERRDVPEGNSEREVDPPCDETSRFADNPAPKHAGSQSAAGTLGADIAHVFSPLHDSAGSSFGRQNSLVDLGGASPHPLVHTLIGSQSPHPHIHPGLGTDADFGHVTLPSPAHAFAASSFVPMPSPWQSPFHSAGGFSPWPHASTPHHQHAQVSAVPVHTSADAPLDVSQYGSMQHNMSSNLSHLRTSSHENLQKLVSSMPSNDTQMSESDMVPQSSIVDDADLNSCDHSRTGILYDEKFLLHRDPQDAMHPMSPSHTDDDLVHPERPARLISIWRRLAAAGLVCRCRRVHGRLASDDELLLVHNPAHIAKIDAKFTDDSMGDTYMCDESPMVSRLAVGGLIQLTHSVVKGEILNAIGLVRPPGHHAEAHQAMGFCLYNNVAVSAAVARSRFGVDRVLIVDWDVHHGNGTQRMFYDDDSVMVMSLHRYDGRFYPGTGAVHQTGTGRGAGYNINIAWTSVGMGDAEYVEAFETIVMPVARQFAPSLVLVSAGFDAAMGDPLGQMNITPAGFATMTAHLMTIADGRCILALEGGYNCAVISRATEACLSTLLGECPPKLVTPNKSQSFSLASSGRGFCDAELRMGRAKLDLLDVRRHLAPFWTCCQLADRDHEEEAQIKQALKVHASSLQQPKISWSAMMGLSNSNVPQSPTTPNPAAERSIETRKEQPNVDDNLPDSDWEDRVDKPLRVTQDNHLWWDVM
jgi:acetoin utilization deacetylase AcuC-like enzyme